jgi:patatin-like phospholipase/acyl hydrolase
MTIPLAEYFDAFSGTSTGAIIAACLCLGYTGREIYDLYVDYISEIFSAPWYWKLNPLKPKYDNSRLIAILKKYLGDVKMSELKKPLFITTTNMKNEKTKVWDRNDDVPVWYAVLTSTAAPTYFDPIDETYSDGGLWANNPLLAGVYGVKRELGIKEENISVFSLGTNGNFLSENKIKGLTAIGWLKLIVGFLTNGNEQATNFYAQNLGLKEYYRFEPTVSKKYEMDDLKILREWTDIWDKLFERSVPKLKEYFEKK